MLPSITVLAFIAFFMLPIQVLSFPARAIERLVGDSDIAAKAKAAYEKRRAKRTTPRFNAAQQIIDVSGAHAFVPPGADDLRGPCPGLNALANHNFLPHDGWATLSQIEKANEDVFGMASELATFLTIYGLVMDGNPLSLNQGWSIGGAPPGGQNLLDNLLGLVGAPQGLIGSHNKYEGDTSPTRGDLFISPNAWKLQLPLFEELFDLQPDPHTANYNMDIMAQLRKITFERSVKNNPYFFYGPFVGMAVSNAAHSFIYRFMANHTETEPEGRLDQFNLKSFFGVTGTRDAFVKKDGWERIPPGWGKRAVGDEYGVLGLVEDILFFTSTYPNTLTIGGNTGSPNTFTPVDFSSLTSGVFSTSTLLDGNNLACFLLQTVDLTAPDFLSPMFVDITEPLGLLTAATGGVLEELGACPQLERVEMSRLGGFPGAGNVL